MKIGKTPALMTDPTTVSVAGRVVDRASPPLVIAEMSGNHNGCLADALRLVDAAADAGADALKLQTYTAETMTIPSERNDFVISDTKSLWYGRSLYELYSEASTPWEWHEELFDRVISRGMIPMSSPFDDTAVEFLEALSVPAYKVASFEITDIQLVRSIAATGKPVLLSTGMATQDEIAASVGAVRSEGNEQIILLKCTSSYPAPPSSMNLKTMGDLRDRFGCHVGLSDHTLGNVSAVASVALGGVVVEKHITLSRSNGGVDSEFSLEPDEFAGLVSDVRLAWESVGTVHYGTTAADSASTQFRRSLYCVKDVERGARFTRDNVRAIRPGYGLPPALYDLVLNSHAAENIARGTALKLEHLDAP